MRMHTDPGDEWAIALGRVMISFGSIEHITLVCLREIPRDEIIKSTASLKFGQRISLLTEILSAHNDVESAKLAELLGRAARISVKRNLIAHNPLVLEVYETEQGYSFKTVIAHVHKDTVITLPELKALEDEAQKLALDLLTVSSTLIRRLKAPTR